MTESSNQISIFGIRIASYTLEALILNLRSIIQTRKKAIVTYVNIQALNLAYKDQRLKNFFNNSDIVYCDGFGVQVGTRILGFDPPERNTPPDWIGQLFQICASQQFSVFFLGSKPGVAEKAAILSMANYPGLNIVGTQHGYFEKAKNSTENKSVIEKINSLAPDVLIVGFGMPMQEFWIEENMRNINATLFQPVGAMLDYLAGEVHRVPRWMTDHGLEWLGRLVIEPQRLWKRYILGIPVFFFRVFKELIIKTLRK
jgi:N-acetylglucosaminyldiphosphoundecaprenol N-acetyl-beta-D-mannosaminyltransferase